MPGVIAVTVMFVLVIILRYRLSKSVGKTSSAVLLELSKSAKGLSMAELKAETGCGMAVLDNALNFLERRQYVRQTAMGCFVITLAGNRYLDEVATQAS